MKPKQTLSMYKIFFVWNGFTKSIIFSEVFIRVNRKIYTYILRVPAPKIWRTTSWFLRMSGIAQFIKSPYKANWIQFGLQVARKWLNMLKSFVAGENPSKKFNLVLRVLAMIFNSLPVLFRKNTETSGYYKHNILAIFFEWVWKYWRNVETEKAKI